MKKKIAFLGIILSICIILFGLGYKYSTVYADDETSYNVTFNFSFKGTEETAEAIEKKCYVNGYDDTSGYASNSLFVVATSISTVSSPVGTVTINTGLASATDTFYTTVSGTATYTATSSEKLYLYYYDVVKEAYLCPNPEMSTNDYSMPTSEFTLSMAFVRIRYGVINDKTHNIDYQSSPTATYAAGNTLPTDYKEVGYNSPFSRFENTDYNYMAGYMLSTTDSSYNVIDALVNGTIYDGFGGTLNQLSISSASTIDFITGTENQSGAYFKVNYRLNYGGSSYYFDDYKIENDIQYYKEGNTVINKYPKNSVIQAYSYDGTSKGYYVESITDESGVLGTVLSGETASYIVTLNLKEASSTSIAVEVNSNYINEKDYVTYNLSDTSNIKMEAITCEGINGSNVDNYFRYGIYNGIFYYNYFGTSLGIYIYITVTYTSPTTGQTYTNKSRFATLNDGSLLLLDDYDLKYYTIEPGTLPDGISLENCGLYPVSAIDSTCENSYDEDGYFAPVSVWVDGLDSNSKAVFNLTEKTGVSSTFETTRNHIVFTNGLKSQTFINVTTSAEEATYNVYYYPSYNEVFDSTSYSAYYTIDYNHFGMLSKEHFSGEVSTGYRELSSSYTSGDTVNLSDIYTALETAHITDAAVEGDEKYLLISWKDSSGNEYEKNGTITVGTSDIFVYGVWERYSEIAIQYSAKNASDRDSIEFGLSTSSASYVSYYENHSDDAVYSYTKSASTIVIHYDYSFDYDENDLYNPSLSLFAKYRDTDYMYICDVDFILLSGKSTFTLSQVTASVYEDTPSPVEVSIKDDKAWYCTLYLNENELYTETATINITVADEEYMLDWKKFNEDFPSDVNDYTFNADNSKLTFVVNTDVDLKFKAALAEFTITYTFEDSSENTLYISDNTASKMVTLVHNADIKEYLESTMVSLKETALGTDTNYIIYKIIYTDSEGVSFTDTKMPRKNLNAVVYAAKAVATPLDLTNLTLDGAAIDLMSVSFKATEIDSYSTLDGVGLYVDTENKKLYYSEFTGNYDIWCAPDKVHYALIINTGTAYTTLPIYTISLTFDSEMVSHLDHVEFMNEILYKKTGNDAVTVEFYMSSLSGVQINFYWDSKDNKGQYESHVTSEDYTGTVPEGLYGIITDESEDYLWISASDIAYPLSLTLTSQIKQYTITYYIYEKRKLDNGTYNSDSLSGLVSYEKYTYSSVLNDGASAPSDLTIDGNQVSDSMIQKVGYNTDITWAFSAHESVPLYSKGSTVYTKLWDAIVGEVVMRGTNAAVPDKMPMGNIEVNVYLSCGTYNLGHISVTTVDDTATNLATVDNVLPSLSQESYIPISDVFFCILTDYDGEYIMGGVYDTSLLTGDCSTLYFWYKSPYGNYIYIGNGNGNKTLTVAEVTVTTDKYTSDVKIGNDSMEYVSGSYKGYAKISTDTVITVVPTDEGYAVQNFTGGTKISENVFNVNTSINLSCEAELVAKKYTVYYFRDYSSYTNYLANPDSYSWVTYGNGNSTENKKEVTFAEILTLDETGEIIPEYIDGNDYVLTGWIDSLTGSVVDFSTMPHRNLYLYGKWSELGKVVIKLKLMNNGVDYLASDSGFVKLYKNGVQVSLSNDQHYACKYDASNSVYTFKYDSTKEDALLENYSIWIKYPEYYPNTDGVEEYVKFMNASDIDPEGSYTLVKFINTNTEAITEYKLVGSGYYLEGSAVLEYEATNTLADDYLGYTLKDRNNSQNVIITRDSVDPSIIYVKINNFSSDNSKYNIYSAKRPFYIYYYSNKKKLYSYLTQTYYYKDEIEYHNGFELDFGDYTFTGWVDSEGNHVTYETMPLQDLVLYAGVSDYRSATINLSLPDGVTPDMIFVSQSNDEVLTEGNEIAYSSSSIHVKYKGTGYLWIHDPVYGDKYIGATVSDKMKLELIQITSAQDISHLTVTGLGYYSKDSTCILTIVPDEGYTFMIEGYDSKENIILSDTSKDISLNITESQIDYYIYYMVSKEVVHADTYHFGDTVTMWTYVGDFDFAEWSTILTTMPSENINVYALAKADYVVSLMPDISKIHEGETLGDAVITGGIILIDDVEVSGTWYFKNPATAPLRSDSLITEYELCFMPDTMDKVPYSCMSSIEVCNPKYDTKNLVSPVLMSRTDSMLSFTVNSKYEYSFDGISYKAGGTVSLFNKKPGERFTVYYRYMEDNEYCTSDALMVEFRTYTEDEYLYVLAQEAGISLISSYQKILDNEDVRRLMAKYDSMLKTSYEDSELSGSDARELVIYMTAVFGYIAEIDEYRGNMNHLNSGRVNNYSDIRCSEIAGLAEENTLVDRINDYKKFILKVFDSADYMVGFYDVKNEDLVSDKNKLTALEISSMESESEYIIKRVDELMDYDYSEYSSIDVSDYQDSFVKKTILLMDDAKTSVHNCDGDTVTSIIGKKVSGVQYMTYMDYKFDRAAYDEAFYIAAEAAVVAHIQNIVLTDIDNQYQIVLFQTKDVNKQVNLKSIYDGMVIKYKDYDTFRAMYLEIIGNDGSVTYEDCLNLFHQKVVESMVIPANSGLTSVEMIVLIGFASVVLICLVIIIVKYGMKKRRYAYEHGR